MASSLELTDTFEFMSIFKKKTVYLALYISFLSRSQRDITFTSHKISETLSTISCNSSRHILS